MRNTTKISFLGVLVRDTRIDMATFLSVSAFVARVSDKLKGNARVAGEASNVHVHARSGHMYFDLVDSASVVHCVVFANTIGTFGRAFMPENGNACQVAGRIAMFAARGQVQLVVATGEVLATQGGRATVRGELMDHLSKEGVFGRVRRPLPSVPQHVGVVTSVGSAAHADICAEVAYRWPTLNVTVVDARVQGNEATGSVASAIRELVARGVDVLICARGGGASEDLEVFDDEVVVRALLLAECTTVSAIGHESDHVILDDVADFRAKTPTAAIQLVVPCRRAMLKQLQVAWARVMAAAHDRTAAFREHAETRMRMLTAAPMRGLDAQRKVLRVLDASRMAVCALQPHAQRLCRVRHCRGVARVGIGRCRSVAADKGARMQAASVSAIARCRRRVGECAPVLRAAALSAVREQATRLREAAAALGAFDETRTLQRGFALVRTLDGRHMATAAAARRESSFVIEFEDGAMTVHINK